MTRFGRWMGNLVILMMPVIAGCVGPPSVEEVGRVEGALVETGDVGCVQKMFAHYLQCRALACPDGDGYRAFGLPDLPAPHDEVCEGCRDEAESVYEECHDDELLGPEALPVTSTVPQWGLPDYRIEVHAAPTPDECVNCAWTLR